MAYVKQVWEDAPSTNTPITAARLNHMEEGIEYTNNYLGLVGKVLWTNPNPTSSFAAQTITLDNDESFDNYTHYEILARQSSTASRLITSGKIPVGYGTFVQWINNYRPTGTTVNGKTIYFEDGKDGSGNTSNTNTVPFKIIGYIDNFETISV